MPHSKPPPPLKRLGLVCFLCGRANYSYLAYSCPVVGGGGGEFHNSLCHWDGKFDTIKEEWKI